MQLIVLGMHRSGTSMVTRLLNLMGAYVGAEGMSIGANEENPKGFWERHDVVDLNNGLLQSAGAVWYRVADFSIDRIAAGSVRHFREKAERLVLDLDAHRPWVIKDPRLCLLFPLWRELLEAPVAVYVHRRPIQVAQSLRLRNGFPLPFGLALWERYTVDCLRSSVDIPIVRVMQEDIMRDPVAAVRDLLEKLAALEVSGLRLPSKREILAFIDPTLFRHKGDRSLEDDIITLRQRTLSRTIEEDFDTLLKTADQMTMSAGGEEVLQTYEQRLQHEQILAQHNARLLEAEHSLAESNERVEIHRRELLNQGEALFVTEQALSDRTLQLAQAEDMLAQRNLVVTQQEYLLAEQSARLLATEDALSNAQKALDESTQRLEEQGYAFAKQGESLQASRADLARAEQALAEHVHRLEQQERSLVDQSETLRAVRDAIMERELRIELLLRDNERLQEASERKDRLLEASEHNQRERGELSGQVGILQKQAGILSEKLSHYHAFFITIERQLRLIKGSARWRVGNAFIRIVETLLLRHKPHLVMDDLGANLDAMISLLDSDLTAGCAGGADESPDVICLRSWLGLLEADFQAVMRSKRWVLGNSITRGVEICIGRPKPTLASDRMRSIFEQVLEWSPSGDQSQDLRQLKLWMTLIDQHLKAFIASRRWQVGKSLVDVIDRLLFRAGRPLVVDHMREVLENYGHWLQDRCGSAPLLSAECSDALSLLSSPRERGSARCDVVVPVFNALEHVKDCLEAVFRHDDGTLGHLIVVNDASDAETSAWLRDLCRRSEKAMLVEHPKNLGYTKAVNTGIKLSSAPFVVLLNSDTVVTQGWLAGLLRCMLSKPDIGIVGPLSNAATWQSVPCLLDSTGHFLFNQLPADMTPDDMARVVRDASTGASLDTPFVNGFCYMIRREVFDRVGLMDEEGFPTGYGEENDFCIRAAQAGFVMRISDDVYVFHAQSKSFGHERRQLLSDQGFRALEKKYGVEYFHTLVERVRDTTAMDDVRERVRASLTAYRNSREQHIQVAVESASDRYRPRRHARPGMLAGSTVLHIVIYSDRPGPELRLTLDALLAKPLSPNHILHLAADWVPTEDGFDHRQNVTCRMHRFFDRRGFLSSISSVLETIGPVPVCIIRQGSVVLPVVIEALVAASFASDGFGVVSPVTNRLAGFSVPLLRNGSVVSTHARLKQSYGDRFCVETPLPDLDVFLLSPDALRTLSFPSGGHNEQSLVGYFLDLNDRGVDIGVVLDTYAFSVSDAPSAHLRELTAADALAQTARGADLEQRLSVLARAMRPWISVLDQCQADQPLYDTVCLIVSTLQRYGGVIVLVNWANQLVLAGVDVRVCVLHYDGGPAEDLMMLFDPRPYSDAESVARELPVGSRIVASLWSTVGPVESLVKRVPGALGYYFIQDYETLFYKDNFSERGMRRAADATYRTPLRKVVTSRWIERQIEAIAGIDLVQVERIPVGIDHSVFPPTERQEIRDATLVVLAMARPETPRRGFNLLIAALLIVKMRYPDTIIRLFGSTNLGQRGIAFGFEDLGIVTSDQLRHVYRAADIFVDTSDFQGFGLCPLEAMALGCSCVLTDSGGISEYAEHEVNSLIVPHHEVAIADAVCELISDHSLRRKLSMAGVQTARQFDCARTAQEWLGLFARDHAKLPSTLGKSADVTSAESTLMTRRGSFSIIDPG